jgi:hypothetical protein
LWYDFRVIHRHDFYPGLRRAPALYETILHKYGTNLYGENIYRVIWGPSRRYLVGGWWEVEREFAYHLQPKYGRGEKWILEKWLPSSVYGTPETWDRQTVSPEGFYQVGPFPAHGEFECVAVFSTGPGPSGYVPLEPGTVDLQARLVFMGRTLSRWDIRQNINAEMEAKKKFQDAAFNELWESLQHTRSGLTMGSAGHYSDEDAVNDYKRRLLQHKDAWLPQSEFQKGFHQDDSLGDE